MRIRITASTIERYGGELVRGVGNVHRRHAYRSGLLLKLYASGLCGVGEASPLPGYSPESLDGCERALRDIQAVLEPIEIESGRAPIEQVAFAVAGVGDRLAGLPSAWFAVETALFDLVGKLSGRSVARCLAPDGFYRRVQLCGLLGNGVETDGLVAEARALIERGVGTLKVKIGRADVPFEREMALLEGLRGEISEPFALRLDANGAWSVAQAQERLALLVPCAPELVEEPVAKRALLDLGPSVVPWAADESLVDTELADDVLKAPGCVALVLKPALLGGLLVTLDLARRAHAAGRDVIVTHLFDGPVALAAACELALALPKVPLACGLLPHGGLCAWPAVELPYFAEPGAVVAADQPGLGIVL